MSELDFDKIAEESGVSPALVGEAGPLFKTGPEQVEQLELGEPGLDNPLARFSIAQGNTLEEKIAAFEAIEPDGELRLISEPNLVKRRVPGVPDPGASLSEQQSQIVKRSQVLEETIFQPFLVFRKNSSEPFRKVDASMREKSEVLNDFIDFIAEDLGALTGEIFQSLRTTRGIPIMAYLRRLAYGAAGGETLQQIGQELAGLDRETLAAQSGRAGRQAGLAFAGGSVFRPADVGVRAAKGGGILKIPPERRDALAAFDRLGLEKPLPGQISDNPFVVLLQAQSSATLPTIPRFVAGQVESVVQVFKSLRNPKAKSNFLATLSRTQQETEKKLIVAARRARGAKLGLRTVGRDLTESMKTLDNKSRKAVNDAYATARSIEEPAFELIGLQMQARMGLAGTPFLLKKQTDNVTEASLRQIGVDETTIRNLMKDIDAVPKLGKAEHLDPDFVRIAKGIAGADPTLPSVPLPNGTVSTATDQLRAWRSELFELAQPRIDEAGRVRRGNALAGALGKEIDAVLATPNTINTAFRGAWDTANNMAFRRFKRLELDNAAIIASSKRPGLLVRRFIKPGAEDNLIELRQLVSNESFGNLQTAFKNDLINDPVNMLKRLDSFDKPTLNLLMSPQDQKVFRGIAIEFNKLERQGLENIVSTTQQADAAMREILGDSMNQADRSAFVRSIMKQGQDSVAFRSTSASLVDFIWREVVDVQKSRQIVNPAKLKTVLNELRDKGMLPLLGNQRRQIIRDLQTVADFPFIS